MMRNNSSRYGTATAANQENSMSIANEQTVTARSGKRSGGSARYVPALAWLPRDNRGWLTVDIIAGLTLWGLVVPR